MAVGTAAASRNWRSGYRPLDSSVTVFLTHQLPNQSLGWEHVINGTLLRCQHSLQDFWESQVYGFFTSCSGFCLIRKENPTNIERDFKCLVSQKDRCPLPVLFMPHYTAMPFSHDKIKQNDFWRASMCLLLGMQMYVCWIITCLLSLFSWLHMSSHFKMKSPVYNLGVVSPLISWKRYSNSWHLRHMFITDCILNFSAPLCTVPPGISVWVLWDPAAPFETSFCDAFIGNFISSHKYSFAGNLDSLLK